MAPAPQGGGVCQMVWLDQLLRVRVPRLCNISNKVQCFSWLLLLREEELARW
jgi:hypothetical protein